MNEASREATANALVEILPLREAERLSAVLTLDDVATLRALVRAATPQNTLRAVASDLAYLEAWSRAATGEPLVFPPNEALALKFIAQHLFIRGVEGAAGQEMPREVEDELRGLGVL